MMHDRTSLLITHRFSTIRMADAIAVIEQGKMSEYGTHEELLARNGTYAQLYTIQAEKYSQGATPTGQAIETTRIEIERDEMELTEGMCQN